ncbi:hypothetical protein A0H76_3035 [Hepatospora eriocheir]|uniref:Uncharacterized protein n=1 Tax=Hepatospora eriocheir TaxID=1081669 RepID=A0A1X0QH22_9MICR|nr:hypothetical protein A0H76_3035 [Hepatospora eriocheir]
MFKPHNINGVIISIILLLEFAPKIFPNKQAPVIYDLITLSFIPLLY